MDRVLAACLGQSDGWKKHTMVMVISSKLKDVHDEGQLSRILDLALGLVQRPLDALDVVLGESLCNSLAQHSSLTSESVMKVYNGFAAQSGQAPDLLWCMSLLKKTFSSHLSSAPSFTMADLSWVDVVHTPAAVALCDGKSVTNTSLLKWLQTGSHVMFTSFTSPAQYERSFSTMSHALDRLWGNYSLDDVLSSLRFVTDCICVEGGDAESGTSSIETRFLGLNTVLMNTKTKQLMDTASVALVANTTSDAALANTIKYISQWPMRGTTVAWLRAIFQNMCLQGKREALFRATMCGLENLVMQLYIPSCRHGALEMIRMMLVGYQTSPRFFHMVLPALRHVFSFLEDEAKFSGSIPFQVARQVDFLSMWEVEYVFEKVLEPPKFDVNAPYYDAPLLPESESVKDAIVVLAKLLMDMMSLHTGFYEWYSPVMKAIRPHLDPDYVTDIALLQSESWTTEKSSSSSKSSHSKKGLVPVFMDTGIRAPGTGVGLNNLGNTCYMNSLIQAFYHASRFRANIYEKFNRTLPLHRELSFVFSTLTQSKKKSISPTGLLKVLPDRYRVGEQQDASEFAKHLLDGLERERRETLVWQGTMCNVVTCCQCNQSTRRTESFVDISLVFPQQDVAGGNNHTLEGMLSSTLSRKDRMEGDNRYRCDSCATLVDAVISVEIVEPPMYLMLTLQRFQYIGGSSKKLLQNVKFGEAISLPVSGSKEVLYDLFAVIFHTGTSAAHGHYYCFARDDVSWQLFNDSVVQRSTFRQISSTSEEFRQDTPYILFFRSREEQWFEPPIPEEIGREIHG